MNNNIERYIIINVEILQEYFTILVKSSNKLPHDI